jgi:hypothetical protein
MAAAPAELGREDFGAALPWADPRSNAMIKYAVMPL